MTAQPNQPAPVNNEEKKDNKLPEINFGNKNVLVSLFVLLFGGSLIGMVAKTHTYLLKTGNFQFAHSLVLYFGVEFVVSFIAFLVFVYLSKKNA